MESVALEKVYRYCTVTICYHIYSTNTPYSFLVTKVTLATSVSHWQARSPVFPMYILILPDLGAIGVIIDNNN
ncbi:MAG: hypothetical protein GDA56_19755 [Hormoscilla sp. GM7CHS1pb]|nr:hypothetical protein [Hormoscilla sp. GM7CHS1pb]